MAIDTNSKVALVTRIVAETFVVSDEEAKECAEGVVALAEGWGDGSAVPSWEEVVRNYFGPRLKWRSPVAETQFLQSKRSTFAAIERYIQNRK